MMRPDNDGVPDFADATPAVPPTAGRATSNSLEQFVPVVVTLPQNVDLSHATLQFHYSASDPAHVAVNEDGGGVKDMSPRRRFALVDPEWRRPAQGRGRHGVHPRRLHSFRRHFQRHHLGLQHE